MRTLEVQQKHTGDRYDYTPDCSGDFLSLQSILEGVEAIPESKDLLREGKIHETVDCLLEQAPVNEVIAMKLGEMFDRNRARTEKAPLFQLGNDTLNIEAFVTHDRSGHRVGEQYARVMTNSPDQKKQAVTDYEVDLYEGRRSRVVIHDVPADNRVSYDSAEYAMKLSVYDYDSQLDEMIEVVDPQRQQTILRDVLYEMVVAEVYRDDRIKLNPDEQRISDDSARQIMRRHPMFAPAVPIE